MIIDSGTRGKWACFFGGCFLLPFPQEIGYIYDYDSGKAQNKNHWRLRILGRLPPSYWKSAFKREGPCRCCGKQSYYARRYSCQLGRLAIMPDFYLTNQFKKGLKHEHKLHGCIRCFCGCDKGTRSMPILLFNLFKTFCFVHRNKYCKENNNICANYCKFIPSEITCA